MIPILILIEIVLSCLPLKFILLTLEYPWDLEEGSEVEVRDESAIVSQVKSQQDIKRLKTDIEESLLEELEATTAVDSACIPPFESSLISSAI